MGKRPTEPTAILVDANRPPAWFDVADVVGDRTLAEIADLRRELSLLIERARGIDARCRIAEAAVEQFIAATIARAGCAGSSGRGFDLAFANWTRTAAGLRDLAELRALVARELDGPIDIRERGESGQPADEPALPVMVDALPRA